MHAGPLPSLPKDVANFLRGKGDVLTVHKAGPGTQALLAARLLAQGRDVVLLVPGPAELHLMRAVLGLVRPPRQGASGPARDWTWLPPYEPGQPRGADWARRWAALRFLALGGQAAGGRGLLTTVDNLLPKWPPLSAARVASLDVRRGEELGPALIVDQAAAWGYQRVPMVTQVGEMALRGDILDIFAPGYDAPLRLAFFGDVLEDVKLFDPATQRSQAELAEAVLLPAAPALLCGAELTQARAHIDHLKTTGQINEAHRHDLLDRLQRGDAAIHPGLFYPEAVNLDAYLPKGAVFLLSGATRLRSRLEEARWAWLEHMEAVKREKSFTMPEAALVWPEEQARKAWTERRQLVFEDLVLGGRKDGPELPERTIEDFSDLFWKPDERQRPFHALVAALKTWSLERAQTLLCFHTERGRRKFLALAEQEGLSFKTVYTLDEPGLFALVGPLKKGFELSWNGARILPEDVLAPRKDDAGTSGRAGAFVGLSRFDDLAQGELLVHRDYGLGRFGGLERLTLGEVANDYLLIHFDGEDKLFLPVDRLRLVQRYKGPEGAEPVLDSLRGGRWARTKERAKKAVEAIARELVELYAHRKLAKGYRYKPAGELFLEFEAGFGFEETPDQAKAIGDVIHDMESQEPMDRLVCGDVGFGKTEVAMRAAFRAVLDGRQVALLCPTTVLAEQHYLNFKNRFQGFPVHVGMLSRFVPKLEQKKTIDAAAKGRVDILVGTHRLLSQDITMPKLGLLILDEEQRFGVKHKERLKELKKNVDCLTLTATPIPRTLQLSLSGIRSLSLIETPPVDRKPVETALIEKDRPLLRTIVQRELERGGQVFWVHNRVQTLQGVAEFVRELVPEARIGMAHGQMNEKELEETIHKFWHRDMDILVCTAIIESGLDFPNANTMIVDQAQMFGLGQLYQLRGRVGRSDRQAYAYFVVPSLDGLSDLARKRLKVILDMDFLGAGFHVAMEDLRLRGAGNILGEAQSGQIARVGLDMYLEMLEEEVRRLKGEQVHETVDTEVNIVFPANIPEKYLPDAGERLRVYRQLAAAETDAALDEALADVADRYGRPPQELAAFVAVLRLKGLLHRLGVRKADLFPHRVVLHFSEKAGVVSPEAMLAWLAPRSGWAKLAPPSKLESRLPEDNTPAGNLDYLRAELASLLPEPH